MELVLAALFFGGGIAAAGYFFQRFANRVLSLVEKELVSRQRVAEKKNEEKLPIVVPPEVLMLAGKWHSGDKSDDWAQQDTIKSLQEAYAETGDWNKAIDRLNLVSL